MRRLIVAVVALLATVPAGAGEVRFTITTPASRPVVAVARVGLPVPAGQLTGESPAEASRFEMDETLRKILHLSTALP